MKIKHTIIAIKQQIQINQQQKHHHHHHHHHHHLNLQKMMLTLKEGFVVHH